MTESAKPPTPPSDTGPLPTDEEAIRAAVSALAARLSPDGPPKAAPTPAGSMTIASAAARPADEVPDAPVTVIPGRAQPSSPPETVTAVVPSASSPRAAAREAIARTVTEREQAPPRRLFGRLAVALLLLILLIGGGVWLMRDQPQVAALLGRVGAPADEPRQAAAPPGPPTQASPPVEAKPVAPPPPSPPAEAKPSEPTPPPAEAKPVAPPPAEAKPSEPRPPAPPAQASEPAPPTAPPAPVAAAEPPQRIDVPLAPEPPPLDLVPPRPNPAAAPPTFDNVLVRDGRAVIAGRAPAGARVDIQVDGRTVSTVEADPRGEWVVILDAPLPPGGHEIRLVQTSPGGAPVASDRTVAVVIPTPAEPPPLAAAPPPVAAAPPPAEPAKPDAAAPAPPATSSAPPPVPLVVATPTTPGGTSQVLQSPPLARDGDLVLGTIDYDDLGRMTIAGQANPGEMVRVYLNNRRMGDAVAGSDGKWTLSPGQTTPHGPHRLRVDRLAVGGAGVAHRLEVPFERVKAKPGDAVTVVWGDNLWNIARGSLGGGERYTAIYRANRNQIRDPNLIYPGQVFVIPKP